MRADFSGNHLHIALESDKGGFQGLMQAPPFRPREQRKLLEKCAVTALSSKLISQQKTFFSRMVVDAVMMLDDLLQLKMIGIKKVQGGALEVSLPWPFQEAPAFTLTLQTVSQRRRAHRQVWAVFYTLPRQAVTIDKFCNLSGPIFTCLQNVD